MTTILSRSLSVAAVLGATLFSADAAQAIGTFSSLPIGACQKVSAGGKLAYQWDGIFNASSTSDMTLECSLPTTYKVEVNFPGYDLRWAVLSARDGNSTKPVRCNMRVLSGGQVSFTGEAKEDGIFMGWDDLDDVPGAVYFSCTLPRKKEGRSGILSFWAKGF